MINRITFSEKRGLFPEYSSLGTIGEKNATTLSFLLPTALQGYSKNIVCVTSQGSFNYVVSNNTFDLPSEVLTDNTLQMQLVLKDSDKVVWKSVPYTFTLNPTLDDSGENAIEEMKKQWTVEAQRPLTILVNRVAEKVTELLAERRSKA